MRSQAALRKLMLRELYRRSQGNVGILVDLNELVAALEIQVQEAETVAKQIAAKRWADFTQHARGGLLAITMSGIEEAEKMEIPVLRRWPSEHPVLFGFLMSVFASALTLSIGKILDILLKARGWL
jgi:hypothetical protein